MGSPTSNFITAPESLDSKHFNHLNPEDLRTKAHKAVDFIADYYKNIESYPVGSQAQPGYLKNRLPETPPDTPESFDTILKDIQNDLIPGITHFLSPNFFGYFPASVSSAAFIGEILCTGFNANGFKWIGSPAVTELEMVVMDWLGVMLKLPKSFMFSGSRGGVVHSTTSEAILSTIVVARDRVLNEIGIENIRKLVVYGSDQTHSTYKKACKIAEADVEEGTTSTTAVDPVKDLAEVANKYNIWVHVDGAYGGNACICPEYRPFFDGIEKVDSLSLSPHKWLLCYAECYCMWVKNPNLIVNALGKNAEYLKNEHSESGSMVSYRDWQVGTSRRFRPLRLWFILRSYGVANLQNHIRSDVQMAITFERLVKSDVRLEIVVPRRFSLVCFRLKQLNGFDSSYTESLNKKLLERVNSTGRVYLTHTVVAGIYMLRFVVGATLTEEGHVINAWEVIREMVNTIVNEF
ncbi:putative pyridoxal phosphate-dependent decarboxylase, pyridoxal phosphate-dependent transferase [Helianthus annuus]|nr:putative pyridoxal phosphate-dependent decarboxylase, pyridoxal phosphate-dependent transferase [Helianthus annuus]